MAKPKIRRVRNQPRHADFVKQRRRYESEIRSMRQALDMVETKESRIHTLISIGNIRLIRIT